MSEKNNGQDGQPEPVAPEKKQYEPPKVESESLMAFGALCNGSTSGGRKASTGGPNFCNASKLLS
ncbi:MAG: hypothetical protein ABL958_18155 [Bdellovibrionia bacterium]